MKLKRIIGAAGLSLLLYACTDEPPTPDMPYDIDKRLGPHKYFGVQLSNELPRGSAFTDSAGEMFAFRSVRVYITNDSTLPAFLTINFSKDFIDLIPTEDEKYKEYVETKYRYKVFVLPDSMTPEKQYGLGPGKNGVNNGLAALLTTETGPATMLKMIRPKETYTLNLGYLFKPADGLTRSEIFSKGHAHNLVLPKKEINPGKEKLDLILGVNVNPPYYYSIVICGQISFRKN